MQKETKHWPTMTVILLPLLLMTFSSCASKKPYYFNDSDKKLLGDANTQPPTMSFEWVCMSKGKFRRITTVNPQ